MMRELSLLECDVVGGGDKWAEDKSLNIDIAPPAQFCSAIGTGAAMASGAIVGGACGMATAGAGSIGCAILGSVVGATVGTAATSYCNQVSGR